MRISDWSSDVCSSDLNPAVDDQFMDGIDLEGALCAATAQHDRETTCHVGSPSEQRTVYRRSVAESGSFGLPRRGSATIAGANVSEATNATTKDRSPGTAHGAQDSPPPPGTKIGR